MSPIEGEYSASERVTVAEAPNLRVRRLALAPGEHVPWHLHTHVTDTFFCMQGPMDVHAKEPEERRRLEPGGTWAVAPGRPHFVRGADGGACRFLVVQGVGPYDYVALEDEPQPEPRQRPSSPS